MLQNKNGNNSVIAGDTSTQRMLSEMALAHEIVEQVFQAIRPQIVDAVDGFLGQSISAGLAPGWDHNW
ncbi:hypothetical protein SH139x_001703 [Planctomycetaceae bacterium SH139]